MSNSSSSRLWPSSWSTAIFPVLLAGLSLAVATALVLKQGPPNSNNRKGSGNDNNDDNGRTVRFACLGNSIQYYNDCPRLLEHICRAAGYGQVTQDSCLRGGASIVSLWNKGNGMKEKFVVQPAMRAMGHDYGAPTVSALLQAESGWDYVIINDHTQWPARQESRAKSLKMLKENYVPLLRQNKAIPIFIMTAGYRVPEIRDTEDLGDFDQYTKKLREGYSMYKQKMDEWLPPDQETRIAPVGLAYAALYHSDRTLWHKLYNYDDFHPSPLGSLLQAFVLYITMTGEAPPNAYDDTWFGRARRMQPPEEDPLPLPSANDASTLWYIAMEICFQCGLTKERLPTDADATKVRAVAMQVCGVAEQEQQQEGGREGEDKQ